MSPITTTTLRAEDILESLTRVIDPGYGINIVDLGLIYGVAVLDRHVHVEMTLTTPGCPLHATIEQAVRRVLETRHPGIEDIQLELVWEPAWDVEKITPAGRAELGW
jgi:metal-sulfur cluster biosynthetic enzyme